MKKFEKGERVQVIVENKLQEAIITRLDGVEEDDGAAVELVDSNRHYYSRRGELINLPEPVRVPQLISNFIDGYEKHLAKKGRECSKAEVLLAILNDWKRGFEDVDDTVYRWVNDNLITLIDAVRNGYVVGKEKKYYVKLPHYDWVEDGAELKLAYLYLVTNITRGETQFAHFESIAEIMQENGWRNQLTEEEIKQLDERYWAFAVPVEEVEAE